VKSRQPWNKSLPRLAILNADFLERTGSENLGARLWRLPPKSANTLHKHIRAEEFYFVLEGVGRLRVGGDSVARVRTARSFHKNLPIFLCFGI